MLTKTPEQTFQTVEILREEEIDAPIDIVFETVLEQFGPMNEAPGQPMPMTLEAWPGGRWFRNLGEGMGHLWGHVQAIKPPTLLEICGPLFMSYPASNNVQVRLTEENGKTHLKFAHRAMGLIPQKDAEGMEGGWGELLEKIRSGAERRKKR